MKGRSSVELMALRGLSEVTFWASPTLKTMRTALLRFPTHFPVKMMHRGVGLFCLLDFFTGVSESDEENEVVNRSNSTQTAKSPARFWHF